MSQPIVNAVWRSDLPDFLKRGVAGKLAALADASGGKFFAGVISINYLAKQRYNGKRLHYQTIRNHVQALQRSGFLEILGVGGGRGHTRTYILHPEALAAVQHDDPMLRTPQRRKGAGLDGRILTRRIVPAAGLPKWDDKGDNKGDNTAETPDISANSHKSAESPPHGPPGKMRSQRGQQRRWDAIRTPDENQSVMVKLAHTYIVDALEHAADQQADSQFEGTDGFKRLVANKLPGQMQNTGQILAALDSAAYQRRMRGLPVPANIGASGQQAFVLKHRKGAGHARMDAR